MMNCILRSATEVKKYINLQNFNFCFPLHNAENTEWLLFSFFKKPRDILDIGTFTFYSRYKHKKPYTAKNKIEVGKRCGAYMEMKTRGEQKYYC